MTPENSLFDPLEPEKKRRRGSTLRLQAQNDNLMQMLAAPENLLAAWHAVRGNIPQVRRARSSGPDGVSLADFERELPAQLSALRHALLRGTYRAQPPVVAGMPKKNGGVRKIAVLNVSDRVAQRAAQQVLEPIFEPGFLPCSYGFRPGLSTRNALEQANQIRAAGNGWAIGSALWPDGHSGRLSLLKTSSRLRSLLCLPFDCALNASLLPFHDSL